MMTRGWASARSFVGLLTAHFRITAAQLRAAVGRPEGYRTPRAIPLCLPLCAPLCPLFFSFVSLSPVSIAQPTGSRSEIERLLSEYIAIDTSNPPGDTRKAAAFLASILERDGIPVTRYESARSSTPG